MQRNSLTSFMSTRCCFTLFTVLQPVPKTTPTLSNLTPFEGQGIINSSGSGTLGMGLFLLRKNTTPLQIEDHNETRYSEKIDCINNLCLAAKYFESLISFLECYGVDVSNIGHRRYLLKDILYCLEKTINGRTRRWLSKPPPLTL